MAKDRRVARHVVPAVEQRDIAPGVGCKLIAVALDAILGPDRDIAATGDDMRARHQETVERDKKAGAALNPRGSFAWSGWPGSGREGKRQREQPPEERGGRDRDAGLVPPIPSERRQQKPSGIADQTSRHTPSAPLQRRAVTFVAVLPSRSESMRVKLSQTCFVAGSA